MVYQIPGSFDLGGHVSHHELESLEFGNGPTELFPFLGIFHGSSQGAFSNTQGLSSYADTAAVQGFHGDLEAFPFFAQQVFFGDFAVFKDQFCSDGGVAAHFVFDLAEAEAGHALFQDEGGNAVYTLALVGHGEYHIGISFFAVGDEDLGAVQDVFVAFQHSRGLLSGSIGPGGRFGQAESPYMGAFCNGSQVFLFLFFGTEHVDRGSAQGNVGTQGDAGAVIHLGQFFHSQDVAQYVQAHAAVFFREADAAETGFAHLVDKLPIPDMVLVSFFNGRSQEFLSKFRSHVLNHLLVFSQVEIHSICTSFLLNDR